MFLKTLDISEHLVWYALHKKDQNDSGAFSSEDRRGRHVPHNKMSDELLNDVRSHINSFPRLAPHYTRSDTKRQFLGSDINKMYDLYVDSCRAKKVQYVKPGVYQKVFCSEFNLSFHQPKKDQCAKRERYKNSTEEEKRNCTMTTVPTFKGKPSTQ